MSLSSYDSGYSSVCRLEHFRTQHELARNFYDDVEFCPLSSFEEVAAHRSRIQQRSPYSSPRPSPPVSYNTASPPKRKAIPIINPENMTPVAVLQQQQQQQQQQQRQRQQYQQQYYHVQESNQMAYWQSYHQERPSSTSSSPSIASSASSSALSSASMLTSSMVNSHVIPIINPSTGQALLHHPMYDVTVR
ncbi:hypothetical protein [Absidia glauca]|uniref:Uncharacterized protein n=1 Tax=Absidia glauca TaxID=4829 RepID=A0A163MKJ1_ABSGL|nr:hypothetical protein [Absidia glauca]